MLLGMSQACGTEATSPPPGVRWIDLGPLGRTVPVGGTITIAATLHVANNVIVPAPRFDWTSDDPTIATVDSVGRVTGQGWGYTTIRATAGEARGSVLIASVPADFTIETLAGSPDLIIGESVVLRAQFRRVGGAAIPAKRAFRWSTANPSAVSISPAPGLDSSHIVVTAHSTGLASISVVSEEWEADLMIGVIPEQVPADAPIRVRDFYFFWYVTAPFLPTMEVEVAPGRSVDVLRIDVAVTGAPSSSFPSLCSTTQLSAGRHAILGEASWLQPFKWSPFPYRQTTRGAALLTYRLESGRVIRSVVRGGIDVWGYDLGHSTQFPWQLCSA